MCVITFMTIIIMKRAGGGYRATASFEPQWSAQGLKTAF